jgi:putative chitinase
MVEEAVSWIGKLQRSLTELGFHPGPVDDEMGKLTLTALFAYMAKPGADAAELGASASVFFPQYRITTALRLAHWFAQFSHESMGFSRLEENLNYSAVRLMQVWPKRFPTIADAVVCANNPERLGNKVYGGRMGNDLPGDGWKYRGRGPGLTGKDNYAACERRTGLPLLDHPEFASKPEHFVHIACDFWANCGANEFADGDNLRAITKAINGGEIGLVERSKILGRIERVMT